MAFLIVMHVYCHAGLVLMVDDNEAPKVTQVDGQKEDNDSSVVGESADEQQSAGQDETQTDDCTPAAKRTRLESEESASIVSSRKSSLSRDDEAIVTSSILLTELLPKKVPVASLNNPDELEKKLVNVLQSKLRKIQLLPEKLDLLGFTLPVPYCQQIQSNLPLLVKIIATCTQYLISKGVKSVTEVLLPPINIDKMEKLFSLDKWYQSLKLDFLECSIEAAKIDEVYLHLVPILTALQSCEVKDVQLHGPVFQAPKAVKKQSAEWKDLMKKVKEQNFTDEYLLKFSLGSVRLVSKSGVVPIKRRRSKESIKKEKKPTKRGKKATAGKESNYLEFTTDATSVPLPQVSHPMSAYEYWDLKEIHKQYTGKGTVLAIVDSGVMHEHNAFLGTADKFSELNYGGPSGNTVDHNGHGTLCAGIAGGNSFEACENPEDTTSQYLTVKPGVAPDAKLVICKVTEGDECIASVDVVIDALKAIKIHNELKLEPIDVVSISMGCYAFSDTLAQAISDLVSQGVIIVCAASNDGHKFHTPICFPARLGNVICVGSHGVSGKASLFSPVGQALDFLAPGEHILGPGNLEYTCQATCDTGTSFAAPAVAGLVCLILECLQKRSPGKASQFHNCWVMKELLREMSTNGGTHTNDRGFGTLTPNRFFRQPERFIDTIDMDILHPNKNFFSHR